MAVTSAAPPAGLPPEVLALRKENTTDFERTLTDSTKVDGQDGEELPSAASSSSSAVGASSSGKAANNKRSSLLLPGGSGKDGKKASLTDKLKFKLFGNKGQHVTTTSKVPSAAEVTAPLAAAPAVTSASASQGTAQQAAADWAEAQGPFEGPEKLLELWFADSTDQLIASASNEQDRSVASLGLKAVPQKDWEEMLDIVKCKVLSVINSDEVDAYLLSESSMFVFPHKIILKTCGTTTLLLGLQRLLELATSALARYTLPHLSSFSSSSTSASTTLSPQLHLGSTVLRCFYSRKSFMFPERQKGPHRDWMSEVAMLDSFFSPKGAAYTVGKMNGDHWLLYMATSEEAVSAAADAAQGQAQAQAQRRPSITATAGGSAAAGVVEDQTLEILMTQLSPTSCARYYFDKDIQETQAEKAQPDDGTSSKGQKLGVDLADKLGLTNLFEGTKIDAFAFEPCGFSANAVVLNPYSGSGSGQQSATDGAEAQSQGKADGYWTIHVTPEEGSSYASFETNVALGSSPAGASSNAAASTAAVAKEGEGANSRPTDLTSLIHRVIDTFEPGKMSITLFVSTSASTASANDSGAAATGTAQGLAVPGWSGNSSVLHQLQVKGYRRTDRIAYEFEGYDLVFVSFEKLSSA